VSLPVDIRVDHRGPEVRFDRFQAYVNPFLLVETTIGKVVELNGSVGVAPKSPSTMISDAGTCEYDFTARVVAFKAIIASEY
jgi:hypothetical protein